MEAIDVLVWFRLAKPDASRRRESGDEAVSQDRLVGQVLHGGAFLGAGFAARVLLVIAAGKSLSPADYGVYGLVVAVVGMSTGLLPLGSPHYVLREVPGATPRSAATIFKSVTGIDLLLLSSLLLVGLPVLGAVRPVAELFALAQHPGLVVLIGIVVFADCMTAEVARFMVARKEIEQGNVVMFLQTGLWGYLAFAGFAAGRLTLSGLLMLWAASLIVALAYGASRLDLGRLGRAPLEPRHYIAAVRFGFPLLSAHVLAGADWFSRFLLASYHSTEVMGVYTYHQNLVLMIAALSSPLIATPFDPHVVSAYSSGQVRRSGHLLSLALRYRLVLVIPLLIVTVVWGDTLVRLLARGDYVASPWLLISLAPVPVLMALANTLERAMFLERRTTVISRCWLIAAAAQILLCLVLVPADPVHGAALALSGAYLVLTALLWRHYRRSTVSIELALGRTALAAAPCLGVAWIVSTAVPSPPPLAVLVVAAAVVGASYLLFANLFGVLSEVERRLFRTLMISGGRLVWTFLGGR